MKAALVLVLIAAPETRPMQRWMQATVGPALKAKNLRMVATSLQRLAKSGPAEYEKWSEIAMQGATAANGSDIEVVRESCASCHELYRPRYRREHRADPLPASLKEKAAP